jgi:hypothetical protein
MPRHGYKKEKEKEKTLDMKRMVLLSRMGL